MLDKGWVADNGKTFGKGGYFGILSDTLGRATLSRQVGAQLRFLRLNQKAKVVEAVGIEPTS